ncbi:hypothetical protein FHS39_002398 [Streptomyces olivoverticillatus]|uniref:Uncharacterized protein n=1 Tax=Streptomyces olivoverticillatus TaxID=66427 RepID=A0A7W7LNK6_9ACTN|nr:hypothetical protein [Streptomyces olivoverticillatus]
MTRVPAGRSVAVRCRLVVGFSVLFALLVWVVCCAVQLVYAHSAKSAATRWRVAL